MKRSLTQFLVLVLIIGLGTLQGCQDQGRRLGGRSTTLMKDYQLEFHSLKKIDTKFKQLQKTPPAVGKEVMSVTNGDLPGKKTICGNQIPFVSITHANTATKKSKDELGNEIDVPVVKADMLFVSGQHMDEHTPPEVMMAFFDQMAARFKTDKAFREELRYITIHIIPIVNVDTKRFLEKRAAGIVSGKETIAVNFGPWDPRSNVFRKNMNDGTGKCKGLNDFTKGTDLNRNYPADWNNTADIIDPVARTTEVNNGTPDGIKYPGVTAQSEQEIRSMRMFMSGLSRLVFILDLHDKLGPEIERGLCTSGCNDMEDILKAMKFHDGKTAKVSSKFFVTEDDVKLPGMLQTYGIKQNVNFVYTIEIGTVGFPPNTAYIKQNGKLLSASFFAMVKEIASKVKAGSI